MNNLSRDSLLLYAGNIEVAVMSNTQILANRQPVV